MFSNRDRNWLLEEKYRGVESPEFFDDLKRLEAGEPLAYVIGWVDFLGCRIDLSKRPLIPRPETEYWTEAVRSSESVVRSGKTKILDLFAGSGCIGVAMARAFPEATVDFADNSPATLEQIRINLGLNNVDTKRTRIIQSDVFANITDRYDLILANPPYIDEAAPDLADPSVRDWEPHDALFAKDGGLYFIDRLLAEARARLNAGGTLYCEFGKGQENDISALAARHGWHTDIRNDQYSIPRWFAASQP